MRWIALLYSLIALELCATPPSDLLASFIFYDIKTGTSIELGAVTPDTVEGFELFYATPGTGDISEIAGHLLLRVKLNNNPWAKNQGFENPHDLVISFLADTEVGHAKTEKIAPVTNADCWKRNWFNLINTPRDQDEHPLASIWQSLKGLSGGFPITMDLQTLEHTLKTYTIEQDRNLLRYQLNLNAEQTRQLLEHLNYVKENYQPPYYFFSQNCGSVLIKVLGEGIGHIETASFSPLVAPPHSLVGNLIRHGIATPLTPSFYSYKKLGFIAQKLLKSDYDLLQKEYPSLAWPPWAAFETYAPKQRAEALRQLASIMENDPNLEGKLYRMAALAQEADMAFSDKGQRCENYTSDATAEARAIQKRLWANLPQDAPPFDMEQLLHSHYEPIEKAALRQGRPHTQLFTHAIGLAYLMPQHKENEGLLSAEGALLKQEMGSSSSIAMQRGSAITLGGVSVIGNENKIHEWSITGLRLEKFRDHLNGISSIFHSSRGFGIGLAILDYNYRNFAHHTHGTLAGIALTGNVISSPQHNDYLNVSVGSDWAHNQEGREDTLALEFPLKIESGVSSPSLEWRNFAQYTASRTRQVGDAWKLSSSLAFYLGEFKGREIKLRVSLDHEGRTAAKNDRSDHERTLAQIQLEINRW